MWPRNWNKRPEFWGEPSIFKSHRFGRVQKGLRASNPVEKWGTGSSGIEENGTPCRHLHSVEWWEIGGKRAFEVL